MLKCGQGVEDQSNIHIVIQRFGILREMVVLEDMALAI